MGIEWSASKGSAGPASAMMASESGEDKGEPPDKPPETCLQVSVYEVKNVEFWKNLKLNSNKITLVRVSSTFSDKVFTKAATKKRSSAPSWSSNLVLKFNTPDPTGVITITLFQNNLPPCPGVPSHSPSSFDETKNTSCGKVILGTVLVPVKLEDFQNKKHIENWYNITVNEAEIPDAKVRIGLDYETQKHSSRSICPGRTINDYFKLESVIGEGVSVVKKGVDKKTRQEVAIKILNPKVVNKTKIKNEAEVMQNMRHPHIVKFCESLEGEDETYLVMELVRGCDLFDFLKLYGNISAPIVGNIIYQTLLAVDYIHTKGFAHCDLKPENILVDFKSLMVKVTDFDFAKKVPHTPTHINGTLQYMAPEVLLSRTYDSSVDIWSLGVIVYKMLSGHYPFSKGGFNQDALSRVLTGKYDFNSRRWANISPSCKDLIQKTLVVDPNLRPTARQLLKHSWISSCSQNLLPKPAVERVLRCKEQSHSKGFNDHITLRKEIVS